MLAVLYIPDIIIMPLAFIINMPFITGEYPDLLKVVEVIPIHKGGTTQDINNYRLISYKVGACLVSVFVII